MASAVKMTHSNTNVVKNGFYGFSWTSFFFSGIPAIVRGEAGIGLGILVGTIVLGALSVGILGILVNVIWAFMFNKNYTHKLLERGYAFTDEEEEVSKAKAALDIAT